MLLAQRWEETCGHTASGIIALQQAALDASADAMVLLVASHPDDRYVLPAAWLRAKFGYRVAVLLATRGGGGQNSSGPETGDELERLRTLEAEAGAAMLGVELLYLDRPDGGFRRSAAETFAEWGRESTLRELARLLREIRPDAVISTHHAEEQHGHDLALVELLPPAIELAAAADGTLPGAPHRPRTFLLGAGSTRSSRAVCLDADEIDPWRGATWRRRGHDVLRLAHRSPGAPAPVGVVFEPEMCFEPQFPAQVLLDGERPLGLPSLFDDPAWLAPAAAAPLAQRLREQLRAVATLQPDLRELRGLLVELRRHASVLPAHTDAATRLGRRIQALEQVVLVASGMQLELEVPSGVAAVAGEEVAATLVLHGAPRAQPKVRAEGLAGVQVDLEEVERVEPPTRGSRRFLTTLRIPLDPVSAAVAGDPMAARFRGDRFVPPVQLRVFLKWDDCEIPVVLTAPIQLRAPVELQVVPRMLLLPASRSRLQFSVGVQRNSQFPVVGELEVRGPAGYGIVDDRRSVVLREQRADLWGFVVEAPAAHKPGVDLLRIRLGATKVALPVHTVDVRLPGDLRVGLLRSGDDTLPNVLGVGGLGIAWSELSDADIAAGELGTFDTIVVDVRALRDRAPARRGFRRLLDFAAGKGHRLVVFYQKDTEFHVAGDDFVGAPFEPFHIARSRVTRADSPVRMLRPDHVLLQRPNRIQPSDWDGWEQERALYLPSAYAQQYEELLELQDPGQPVERSALLYARTGDGEFVYCALSLWRQLKKLHPGAVRLLANLLTPITASQVKSGADAVVQPR
jgi:hypothetical protein